MIDINGVKKRNLQEQVGYNAEQIEKIFSILDGLNVQDNTVVISDISQTLTAEEIEIVKMPVSFIVYNGRLYLKKSESATEAKFDVVFAISGGSTITFSSSEITVTLSNGALGVVNTTNSTYSVSQIDTKVGAKADTTYVDTELAKCAKLTGATFTGAVKAQTLAQTQANFYQNVSVTGDASLTVVNVYNRFEQIGNVLFVIINVKLTNNTGASITRTSGNRICYSALEINSSVADKIYDIAGTSLAESPATNNTLVTAFGAKISAIIQRNGDMKTAVCMLSNRTGAGNCSIDIYAKDSVTIPDGDSIYVFARAPLTLL